MLHMIWLIRLATVLAATELEYRFYEDLGQIIPDSYGNGYDGINGATHLVSTGDNDFIQVAGRGLYGDGNSISFVKSSPNTYTSTQTTNLSKFTMQWMVRSLTYSFIALMSRADGSNVVASLKINNTGLAGYWTLQSGLTNENAPQGSLPQDEWHYVSLGTDSISVNPGTLMSIWVDEMEVATKTNPLAQIDHGTSPQYFIGAEHESDTGKFFGFIHSCVVTDEFGPSSSHYSSSPPSCYPIPCFMAAGTSLSPSWDDSNPLKTPAGCSQNCDLACTDTCFDSPTDCEAWERWPHTSCKYDIPSSTEVCMLPCFGTCDGCVTENDPSTCLGCVDVDAEIINASGDYWTCKENFYNDDSGDEVDCVECHPYWKRCANNNMNNCIECSDIYAVMESGTPGPCTWPTIGFYTVPTYPLECAPWDPSCETCSGTTNTDCLTWATGAFQSNTDANTCYVTCPDYFFGDTDDMTCKDCFIDCMTCSGPLSTECLTCRDSGAFVTINGTCICNFWYWLVYTNRLNCSLCATECETCAGGSTNDDCTEWKATYYLQSPTASSTSCRSTWPTGYFGDDNTKEWTACFQDWLNCADAAFNSCNSCKDSLATLSGGEWGCATGLYIISTGPLQWGQCTTECEECSGPSNNECLSCSTGYFMQTPVASSQTCRTSCLSNETEENVANECVGCYSECATCSGINTNDCLTCVAQNATPVAGTCTCDAGTYTNTSAASLECLICDGSCVGCTGTTNNTWVACASNYFLQPPVATSTQCRTTCPKFFFGDSATGQWDDCHADCARCTGPNQNECTECIVAYSQPQATGCECTNNRYKLIQGASYVCIECATEWSACDGTTNDDCTSCSTGHYKQPPIATSKSCRATCPSGFVNNAADDCVACHGDCKEWNGELQNNCTECHTYGVYPDYGRWFCRSDQFIAASGPLVCEDCAAEWSTCNGSTNDECIYCSSTCFKQPPAATSTSWRSTCPAHHYATDGCFPCDNACDTCDNDGDTSWLSCSVGYYMQPPAGTSKTWLGTCPIGYTTDDVLLEWLRCDPACAACFNLTNSGCIACNVDFYTQPDNTSQCADSWPEGYFADVNTQSCQACHNSCKTCTGASNSHCDSCHSSISQEIVSGRWVWLDGYYQESTNPFLCSACNSACTTWYGKEFNNCQTCAAEHAEAVNGECTCSAPFSASRTNPLECKGCPNDAIYTGSTWEIECPAQHYESNYECVPCVEPCLSWSDATHCTECPDGYFINKSYAWEKCGSTCVSCENNPDQCLVCVNNLEKLKDDNTCSCKDSQALVESFMTWVDLVVASIQVSSTNVVTLELSRDPGVDLTADDITLAIKGTNGALIDFTFEMTKQNAQNYELQLTPKSVPIPAGSQVNLELSQNIIERAEINSEYQVLNDDLNEQQLDSTVDEIQRMEDSEEATSNGSTGVLGSAAFVSTLSYNFAALWKIINYLQVITLFQFINVETTPELDGFLASLLKDSKIPNIYDLFVPDEYDAVSMPDRFMKSSYKYPLLLDIFGHTLSIWLMMLSACTIGFLLQNSRWGIVRKIAGKVKEMFIYNALIRMVLETCIYIFLGCALNLRYGVANDVHSHLNLGFSIAFLVFMAVFAWLCARVLTKHYGDYDNEAYIMKFKELTNELRDDPLQFSVYYSIIFMFRRASLVLIIVFVESAKIQIFMTALVNISYFMWIITARPFATVFINLIEAFCEFCVVFVNCTMWLFTFDYQYKKELGVVIILVLLSAIGGYMAIIIRHFIMRIKKKCDEKKHKISPDTPSNPAEVTEIEEDTEKRQFNQKV